MSKNEKKTESEKTEANSTLIDLQSIISTLNRPGFQPLELSKIQSTNSLTALLLENLALKLQIGHSKEELDKYRKVIDELKSKIIADGTKQISKEK